MFGRNIDMLWCFQYRYHVRYRRVLSFEYNEHKYTGFVQSWSMQKPPIKNRAQLTANTGSTVGHRCDLDNDSDDDTCDSPNLFIQGATNTR
jgi:hypothetical protein